MYVDRLLTNVVGTPCTQGWYWQHQLPWESPAAGIKARLVERQGMSVEQQDTHGVPASGMSHLFEVSTNQSQGLAEARILCWEQAVSFHITFRNSQVAKPSHAAQCPLFLYMVQSHQMRLVNGSLQRPRRLCVHKKLPSGTSL